MILTADQPPLTTRTVQPEDRTWLVELRNITMNPHLKASGIAISAEENQARVETDFEHIRIVRLGHQRIGMIKALRDRRPWKLVQIQIDPVYQNQGIGGRLVAALIDDARLCATPLELSVLSVNPAKHLYLRLGFYALSERDGAIQMRYDPTQEDCT
jgi:ribosomal protein S18 acetylase RimI-like enzyme